MERTITVLSDLKDLGELLQGAAIDQAVLAPSTEGSPEAGGRGTDGRVQLVIEGTRAMIEQPQLERGGWFKRPKTPWTKFRLTLDHITRATMSRVEQAADQSPLLACEAVAGGYRLTVRTPDGLQLVLAVDRVQGAFADAGSVIRI